MKKILSLMLILLAFMLVFASCDQEEDIDFGDDESVTSNEDETSTKEPEETSTDDETSTDEPAEDETSTDENTETVDPENCIHEYEEESRTEPNCTEAGMKVEKCKYCGTTRERSIAKLGHNMGTPEVVEPTCNKAGYTERACTRPGCTYATQTNPTVATGKHAYSKKWRRSIEPTYFCPGEEYVYCTNVGCDSRQTREVAPLYDFFTLDIGTNNVDIDGEDYINIAKYGVSEATSYYRKTLPKHLFDGDTSSYWSPDTLVDGVSYTGDYAVQTFVKDFEIKEIRLYVPNYHAWGLDGVNVEYLVQAEDEDGAWVTLGTVNDKDSGDDISQNVTVVLSLEEAIVTDKIKITVTEASRYAPGKIYEVEVYAKAAIGDKDIVDEEGNVVGTEKAPMINRVVKNIAGTASVSVSGKYNDYGGGAAELVDGKDGTSWMTNARLWDDTRFEVDFGENTFREISSISFVADKYVGEKFYIYYYGVASGWNGDSLGWRAIDVDPNSDNQYYEITEDFEGTYTVTFENPIITTKIRIEAEDYKAADDLTSDISTVPPTMTQFSFVYKETTLGSYATTKEETDEEGNTVTVNLEAVDIFKNQLAALTVADEEKTHNIEKVEWLEGPRTIATFEYTTVQYIAYIRFIFANVDGRDFSLQYWDEENECWVEYMIIEGGKSSEIIDLGVKWRKFRFELISEPQYWLSFVYEITPYTIVEQTTENLVIESCEHKAANSTLTEKIAPTCETAGYSILHCKSKGCTYTWKTDALDALGHNYVVDQSTVVAATSDQNGTVTAKCSKCSDEKTVTTEYATELGILKAPEITTYLYNAPGAWSMTFDDSNYVETYNWVVPQLQKYGFKATTVMTIAMADSLVPQWTEWFATGTFDLGSHSYNHTGIYSGGLQEDSIMYEINEAHYRFMNMFPGQKILGFATPNGATSNSTAIFVCDIMAAGRNGGNLGAWIDPDNLTSREAWGNLNSYISKSGETEGKYEFVKASEVKKNYVYDAGSNRIVDAVVAQLSITGTYVREVVDDANFDGTRYNESNGDPVYRYVWVENGSYSYVNGEYVFQDNNDGEYILAHTEIGSYEKAVNDLLNGKSGSDHGYWTVECLHSLGWGSIYSTFTSNISKFEAFKKTGVWVGSYTEVVQYIKESQRASIEFSATADSITFNLTDTLDNSHFDQKLTVKVDIPDEWTAITVMQNGVEIGVDAEKDVFIENGYAYISVVPDCGEVVITAK